MDSRNRYEELMVKYLMGALNNEEKAFVENCIATNEQDRIFFERLRSTWNITGLKNTLEQVNVEDEWQHFRQATIQNDNEIKPLLRQEENEDHEDEAVYRRHSNIYRIIISTAIAASVLLVIGLGWVFIGHNKKDRLVVQNAEKKADSLMSFVRHERNTTGKDKRITLPDGSLIVLADKSEIIYREPFTDKRDITLMGKAYFKVAKDKAKPFTVISDDISTTALGTEFTVTTLSNTGQIIVRLYEGKVVIKAVNGRLKKDVYLSPGQAFIYDVQTTAKLKTFKLSDAAVPEEIMNEEVARDNPSLPENAETPYFMFNNQSLSEVFDLLSKMYQVTIVYNKKDVQNLYFIRKYNSTEKVDNILKEIATLNNLSLRKNNDTFVVSK